LIPDTLTALLYGNIKEGERKNTSRGNDNIYERSSSRIVKPTALSNVDDDDDVVVDVVVVNIGRGATTTTRGFRGRSVV
jgi:hypothetical protein